MNKEKKQNYFNWIFTRWYFYVIALLFYVMLDLGQPLYLSELLGRIVGDLIISFIIISFFVLVKKIFLWIIEKFKK